MGAKSLGSFSSGAWKQELLWLLPSLSPPRTGSGMHMRYAVMRLLRLCTANFVVLLSTIWAVVFERCFKSELDLCLVLGGVP